MKTKTQSVTCTLWLAVAAVGLAASRSWHLEVKRSEIKIRAQLA